MSLISGIVLRRLEYISLIISEPGNSVLKKTLQKSLEDLKISNTTLEVLFRKLVHDVRECHEFLDQDSCDTVSVTSDLDSSSPCDISVSLLAQIPTNTETAILDEEKDSATLLDTPSNNIMLADDDSSVAVTEVAEEETEYSKEFTPFTEKYNEFVSKQEEPHNLTPLPRDWFYEFPPNQEAYFIEELGTDIMTLRRKRLEEEMKRMKEPPPPFLEINDSDFENNSTTPVKKRPYTCDVEEEEEGNGKRIKLEGLKWGCSSDSESYIIDFDDWDEDSETEYSETS